LVGFNLILAHGLAITYLGIINDTVGPHVPSCLSTAHLSAVGSIVQGSVKDVWGSSQLGKKSRRLCSTDRDREGFHRPAPAMFRDPSSCGAGHCAARPRRRSPGPQRHDRRTERRLRQFLQQEPQQAKTQLSHAERLYPIKVVKFLLRCEARHADQSRASIELD